MISNSRNIRSFESFRFPYNQLDLNNFCSEVSTIDVRIYFCVLSLGLVRRLLELWWVIKFFKILGFVKWNLAHVLKDNLERAWGEY